MSFRTPAARSLQHLPSNQRAALLLFEVLGFSAAEIAAMMRTSTTSVNSALARARKIVARDVPPRTQQQRLRDVGDDRIRKVVTAFSAALENGDADALVALLAEDVTWSMPPLPHWYQGIEAVMDHAVRVPLTGCGSWQNVPTSANAQPALACYLWNGDAGTYLAWSLNVLTLSDERITAITSFLDPGCFEQFGLPPSRS